MATQAPRKEWLVILPDNAGVLERRMEVRPDHIKVMAPLMQTGRWTLGGATLDEHPKEGEGPKANGSVLLGYAETKEEMLEAVKQDIYFQSGVWDPSKVQILPFRTALRREFGVGL